MINPDSIKSTERTSSVRLGYWRFANQALGFLIAVIGLLLTTGGLYLISLGGSKYFATTGIFLMLAGTLLFRSRRLGAWVFGGVFLLSIVWAYVDTGLAYWPLFSRLLLLDVLAIFVVLSYPRLNPACAARQHRRLAYAIASALVFTTVLAVWNAFTPKSVIAPVDGAAVSRLSGMSDVGTAVATSPFGDTRFSPNDEINRTNVRDLKLLWTAHTGDVPPNSGSKAEDQNTPLFMADTVYVCTASSTVHALDAETGVERWNFDPKGTSPDYQRCRGLGFYEVPSTPLLTAGESSTSKLACRRRLFVPTDDARLIAIDADDGKPCMEFGVRGVVDLKVGMGEVKKAYYVPTSAPLVAGHFVVIGGRVIDNMSTGEPPGVVRAFDARSGALQWAWDPGNPDLTTLPPDGETYTRGTPNVWSAMSYDSIRQLIYLPVGNATPDFWGGERTTLDDRFSSSVVALEADTGHVRWSFQTTHHDLWDYDVPAQPLLYESRNEDGSTTPALAQVTKQGMIFLLNRETGIPISRISERRVPTGDVPGERYSATQPFSVEMPGIGNEALQESDMWGMTLLDQLLCRIQFKRLKHQGLYTPGGIEPSLQFPGTLGGMNWGGASLDPETNYLYVNDIRLGSSNYLVPRSKAARKASGGEIGYTPQEGTPFASMRVRFLSVLGVPCQKPPYGTMSAVDLQSHKLLWQVPVGTLLDTGPLGLKMHLPIPIGMPTLGPSLTTQGGLVFFAGTQDYYLRAFNSSTGAELWKARLPVGSQAGPITYISPKTRKQILLVTAGGARQSPDRGDYVLAFGLP